MGPWRRRRPSYKRKSDLSMQGNATIRPNLESKTAVHPRQPFLQQDTTPMINLPAQNGMFLASQTLLFPLGNIYLKIPVYGYLTPQSNHTCSCPECNNVVYCSTTPGDIVNHAIQYQAIRLLEPQIDHLPVQCPANLNPHGETTNAVTDLDFFSNEKRMQLQQYPDDLIFYIFYNFPEDQLQNVAAFTLFNKGWRYHIDFKVWLARDPNWKYFPLYEQELSYYVEYGVYNFFNIKTWSIQQTEMICDFSRLDFSIAMFQ